MIIDRIRRGCPDAAPARPDGGPQRPAVFFDRDGVLNIDQGFTHRVEDFVWSPGAESAIRLVRDWGWRAIVVTNQSGIGRGLYSEEDFLALSEWMLSQVELDAIYYCPHAPEANCPARKPGTAMLEAAFRDFDLDRDQSLLIGDRDSDLQAAAAFGLRGFRYEDGDLRRMLEQISSAETA